MQVAFFKSTTNGVRLPPEILEPIGASPASSWAVWEFWVASSVAKTHGAGAGSLPVNNFGFFLFNGLGGFLRSQRREHDQLPNLPREARERDIL
jgi:hypothetical protein